jgi:arsenite methyltransferase
LSSTGKEAAMSTDTQTLDTRDLERRVKQMYREVAEEPFKEFHFETGRALAERLGYSRAELDAIPAEAIDSFAGVGHYFDLARIQPGETVVDLGSGSGMDSFLAARQVGESGRVIGIDMTEAQLAKGCRLIAEHGFTNVEFVEAHIEQLPLPDASADVVISNGVINLAPDKAQVFEEAARVLRPGGRLALADIVTSTQLPDTVTCDASLWAACIGGAMQRDDYRETIEAAGFELDGLKENDEYRFVSQRAENATKKYGVNSVSLLAIKR